MSIVTCPKFNISAGLSLVPCLSFSPLHENASSPLLDLESIALGVLLRSNQRSSSYLFLHMLRHLSLIFTEVRPGGKGYSARIFAQMSLSCLYLRSPSLMKPSSTAENGIRFGCAFF